MLMIISSSFELWHDVLCCLCTTGILNGADKCPKLNVTGDQADGDSDGVGDKCDNCPSVSNSAQVTAHETP